MGMLEPEETTEMNHDAVKKGCTLGVVQPGESSGDSLMWPFNPQYKEDEEDEDRPFSSTCSDRTMVLN